MRLVTFTLRMDIRYAVGHMAVSAGSANSTEYCN
jgi:hypothetical protein